MSPVELEFVHIKCYGKVNRALAGAENLSVNAELLAVVGFVFCSWIYGHSHVGHLMSQRSSSARLTFTAVKLGSRVEDQPHPLQILYEFLKTADLLVVCSHLTK